MSWYDSVPKDLEGNLEFRRYCYAQAKNSPEKRAALIEACRQDILFYFNTFVFTFDPRLDSKVVPFITYEFQDEGILAIQSAIHDGKPMVIEKSRDMGASWMCLGVMDYEAQFVPNSKFLMISRNADLVDKRGEADSLFWKIDFIHKHLPSWMLDTDVDVSRRLLAFEYHKTNSAVTGSSTTDASGIGGRATAAFIDEFSRFDPTDARMIKSGLADVSRCRIFNFTPSPEMGELHPSYELVEQARKGRIRSQRWHWRTHPEKCRGLYRVAPGTRAVEIIDTSYVFPPDYEWMTDGWYGEFEFHSPWFDSECVVRGNARDIREMLEIDYTGSGFNFFEFSDIKEYALRHCRRPDIEGELRFNPETAEPISFDIHAGGTVKLWMQLDSYGAPPKFDACAGVDVSFGKGATNSCFSLARLDTGQKVLEFTTPFSYPDQFAVYCVALCKWLNNAWIYWEQRGPGDTFGDVVVQLRYGRIFVLEDKSKMGHPAPQRYGWNPTGSNRDRLLSAYRTALSKTTFSNPSLAAIEETLEWVRGANGYPQHKSTSNRRSKKGVPVDPSGAEQNHGDRVIADALCNCVLQELGTSVAQIGEPKAEPGTLAWLFAQEEKPKRSVLYPNWRGK